MIKLIIEREFWLRGEGSLDSRLLRPSDGKMCCLGYYGKLCGLTTDQIKDIESPQTIEPTQVDDGFSVKAVWVNPKQQGEWLFMDDNASIPSVDCENLMVNNDDEDITDTVREQLISKTFAKHDIEVQFI